jgi:hypothetical protein
MNGLSVRNRIRFSISVLKLYKIEIEISDIF